MTLPFFGGFEELDKAAMSGIDVQPTMQGQRQMRSETVASEASPRPSMKTQVPGYQTYGDGSPIAMEK